MKNIGVKTWLLFGGIIIVAIVLYYAFFSNTRDNTATLDAVTASPGDVDNQMVLNLLNQIQQIRIDTEFFKSAAYNSLLDYTVPIPEQGVGRANPFAPIPGYVVPKGALTPAR